MGPPRENQPGVKPWELRIASWPLAVERVGWHELGPAPIVRAPAWRTGYHFLQWVVPKAAAVVVSVAIESYSGTLWDLTVEGAHTFFVGKGEWLVPNCPASSLPSGSFFGRNAVDRAADAFGVDRRALGDLVEELKEGIPVPAAASNN